MFKGLTGKPESRYYRDVEASNPAAIKQTIEQSLSTLSQQQIGLMVAAVDSAYRTGNADISQFTPAMRKAFKVALAKKSNGSLYGYQRRRLQGNSDY